MKTTVTSFIAVAVLFGCILAATGNTSSTTADYATIEAVSLADACQMVALINDDKWEEVEKKIGTKEGMIAILKQTAQTPNWPGIGAYRGSRTDKVSPREVTHRFGFAPRTNPHELWLTYTLIESGISKPRLMVLGW